MSAFPRKRPNRRHGQRPAHIHFFVSAPGHRHLTTQINIAGDKYLYDDFAFATREGLIPKIARHEDAKKMKEKQRDAARDSPIRAHWGLVDLLRRQTFALDDREELNTPFSEIEFDFTLTALAKKDAEDVVNRRRVEAA